MKKRGPVDVIRTQQNFQINKLISSTGSRQVILIDQSGDSTGDLAGLFSPTTSLFVELREFDKISKYFT